jgi:hypothetical protein
MAKKKKTKSSPGRLGVLQEAKAAHQFEVGAGASIQTDPYMTGVRGVQLPSLAMMELLGFTALRDSCTILIDGDAGSSKSTLALELFNWIRPYGGTGVYIDAENKSAADIAAGLLDNVHLWHHGHKVDFRTQGTIEEVQASMDVLVDRCKKANETLDRDEQIPFIGVIDPIAGVSSEEVIQHTKKEGHSDRGHGGRDEALLWTKWIKTLNHQILQQPFIGVFVNHVKTRQEKRGPQQVERKVNPGGSGQNYAATIAIRCNATSKQKLVKAGAIGSHGDYYQDIWLECTKNSRGPTGNRICVRKYATRLRGGITRFWWDWPRATTLWLSEFGPQHGVNDIVSVRKASDTKASCKQLGLKDVSLSEVGEAIHADESIMKQLIDFFCWRKIREYAHLTDEEYQTLVTEAEEVRQAYIKEHADELEGLL